MNWKRIGRTLVCLLVVLCLIVNISPIRAQAFGLGGLLGGGVMAVPGANVVAAVLIGLGVCVGVTMVDWDQIVIDCRNHLKNEGIIDENGKIDVLAATGVSYLYAVSQELVETVRDWLYANEIVKVANLGYQGTTTAYCEFGQTATKLNSAGYPLYDALHLAYAGNQVAVYGLDASYLYGFYFSSNRLYVGRFTNPYGKVKASYCTMYDRSTLTLVNGYNFAYLYVYPTTESALASSSTATLYAIDWTKPDLFTYSGGAYISLPMFTKSSSSGSFGTTSVATKYRICSPTYEDVPFGSWEKLYVVGACQSMSGVTSDYDVSLGVVADPDTDITDGYSTWAGGVVAIPGTQVGSDEESIPYWPIGLGQTYEDTSSLTQEDVWAGTSTYTPSASEKYTGTFADTTVGSFIDALVDTLMAPIKAIFVPSSDFITAKVEALRAEFAFADAIISTGEFIGTSLADLETEPPVIYIDLGASRGDYDLGGVVPFVDLRWYEEYKPTGDALLSAFMWVAFAWRMFVKAPGIISGMPGDFVMDGVNSLGMVDALPTRKKEYALQRQANRRLKDK